MLENLKKKKKKNFNFNFFPNFEISKISSNLKKKIKIVMQFKKNQNDKFFKKFKKFQSFHKIKKIE